MTYTGYQLLWFFLIYSFVGWCGEVAVSVIKQHKFVNRGFVTGPLCPIYGMGAFAFAIFLPDLKSDRYVFLWGTVLGGAYEYVCSVFTEAVPIYEISKIKNSYLTNWLVRTILW